MDSNASFSEKLQDILEKEAFSALEEFSCSHIWTDLDDSERFLLGKLFIKKGETELKNGDTRFQESFALAESVCPANASIFLPQRQSLYFSNPNCRCLSAAIEAFEQAVVLEPHFFEEGFFRRAKHSFTAACSTKTLTIFKKAQHKYQEAFAFLEHQPPEIESRYFWKWGLSCHLMGMTSEEPFDFHQAIQKYRQAQQLGQKSADFWQDFAEALVELSKLVKQPDLCSEAVDYYHQSVSTEL